MLEKFTIDSCKLLYTDSLIYDIICNDIYDELIKKYIHLFDTSEYLADNIFKIPLVNMKVAGLMKDENCGNIMTECVELRSKMYSIKVNGSEAVNKAKGVESSTVKHYMFSELHRLSKK